MVNYTKNYHLKKPLPEEYFNVEDQNGNMDILDTALASHEVDKNNPHAVTAAQIGAASAAEHNIRTYTSLEQLGLSDADFEGKTTFVDAMELLIASKMPANSILNFSFSGTEDSFLTQLLYQKITDDLSTTWPYGTNLTLQIEKAGTPSTGLPIKVYGDNGTSHGIALMCMFDRDNGVPNITKFHYYFHPNGFLPLSGGTLTGNNFFNGNGYGRWYSGSNALTISINPDRDIDTNARAIYLASPSKIADTATALQYNETIDGVSNSAIIYTARNIVAKTTDLTAGTSALTTNCIYQMYK